MASMELGTSWVIVGCQLHHMAGSATHLLECTAITEYVQHDYLLESCHVEYGVACTSCSVERQQLVTTWVTDRQSVAVFMNHIVVTQLQSWNCCTQDSSPHASSPVDHFTVWQFCQSAWITGLCPDL